MWMSACTVQVGAGNATGTNEATGKGAAPARRRHLCTTLALIPCDSATLATDVPRCAHSLRICALSSAPWRRRTIFLESFMVST